MIKYDNNNILNWKVKGGDIVKTYYHNIPCFQKAVAPSLKWITFSNGDTISSDLQIYGVKGIASDLGRVFDRFDDGIYFELDKGKYNVIIGGYGTSCYIEDGIASNTSVEYIFSNVGCSDSYTVSNHTITYMSNDIQLLIYA